jgi:1,4-alpha-glucan branching enzyme
MHKGFLAVHLHAHLPYVRHPEHSRFLEEKWFFDAIVDTYVPLLVRFDQLHQEGVPFRLSMTLTPTLLAMFADELLMERFSHHLDRQLSLCAREQARTENDEQFRPIVEMYRQRLSDVMTKLSRYGGNLTRGFRRFADEGHLELITCGVTHGFLPHMQLLPGAVARQLRMAVEAHERYLDRRPDGIWLPECGYYPGLEAELLKQGLLYFFADSHALYLARPRSLRGVFSHVYMPNGVAAFARDIESSKQVWSVQEGYPGDGVYRDFYRDVGFDLPLEYVAPYVHDGHTRILTGFKYYAITGDTDQKVPYQPALASSRAREHAYHFIWCREQQIQYLATQLDREPVIVAPYDAELFGHWWFEGPEFLYWLFKAAAENAAVETIAAKDYLVRNPSAQIAVPNASTWGDGGYNRVWINATNEWVYPHLAQAARRVQELEQRGGDARQLAQLRRELVMAQASDWAFIMTTGTSPGYATLRSVQHLANARALAAGLAEGRDVPELEEMERRTNVF